MLLQMWRKVIWRLFLLEAAREGRGDHVEINIKRISTNIMLHSRILMVIPILICMKNGKKRESNCFFLVILKKKKL